MANDFLPFGIGAGANVLAQADYVALTARVAGFSSGTAKSIELNKVWRQSSVISSILAQMIADRTGLDVLDDGNTDALKTNLVAAVSDIASQGITAIAGLTNANVTLTASQAAKPIVTLAGALTGNVQVIFPANKQCWLVVNNATGIFILTCKTASGAGVVVPNGNSALIFGDGTAILTSTGIQASETQQGTAKIATQAGVETGTEDGLIVTPKKLMQAIKNGFVQGTESIFGLFKVATQAQTNAGADDATVVTPKKLRFGFSISLGQSGYVTFPSWLGGTIIQWGGGTINLNTANGSYMTGTVTATFPIPFPSGAYRCIPVIGATPQAIESISISALGNSSASLKGACSGAAAQAPTYSYIVIGA